MFLILVCILPEFGQFSVALLVHFNLGLGTTLGFLQTVGQSDKLTLQIGSFAFNSLPQLPLAVQIFLEQTELVLK